MLIDYVISDVRDAFGVVRYAVFYVWRVKIGARHRCCAPRRYVVMVVPAARADPGITLEALGVSSVIAGGALVTMGHVALFAQDLVLGRAGFVSMRLPPPGLFNIAPRRFCGLVLRDFKRTRRTEPVLLDFLANLSSPVLVTRRLYTLAEYTEPLPDKAAFFYGKGSEH